jgi:hypothetical protein
MDQTARAKQGCEEEQGIPVVVATAAGALLGAPQAGTLLQVVPWE